MNIDYTQIAVGCEIELTGITRMRVAEAIRSVVGGGEIVRTSPASAHDPHELIDRKGRKWQVVADASLTSVPQHLRAEINTPILSHDDLEEMQQVLRSVRLAGAKVDKNCSVHLHTSSPHLDAGAVANLARIVYKNEDLIFAAFGVTPERMSRYAKKMPSEFARKITARKPRNMDELNTWWYGTYNATPTRLDPSRYVGINLNGLLYRGAVEFRYFQFKNKLHAGELRAWMVFCMALTAKAINAKAASGKRRKYIEDSGKFDFRVFISHGLGLHGPEHHNVRMHLLARLKGDTAWRNPARRRSA